ncbi:hypothetical protein [Myxosarcina sp. GI1]|uniref:hypothetical protein n=1 Tax=Myxosarcina sp. GI1 TaxID=1541065 RepID=UPI000563EC05|nr:hypothetical protein [Myxosarcina sp. GI1]
MQSSIDPDYPNVILTFTYRGFDIQVSRDKWQEKYIYSAWANYELGSALAVPGAVTTKLAIRNAKHWVDRRISLSDRG